MNTQNNNSTIVSDGLDRLAEDALARALLLPPGIERHDALKLASRLRYAAGLRQPLQGQRGRPKKTPKSDCD